MKSFGGHKKFSSEDRGHDRPTMHNATCSKCNKQCEVPFRPNGSKPILCSDCFHKEGGGQRSGGFERKRFEKPGSAERLPDPRPAMKAFDNELTKMNAKLDKILKLLDPTIE